MYENESINVIPEGLTEDQIADLLYELEGYREDPADLYGTEYFEEW